MVYSITKCKCKLDMAHFIDVIRITQNAALLFAWVFFLSKINIHSSFSWRKKKKNITIYHYAVRLLFHFFQHL